MQPFLPTHIHTRHGKVAGRSAMAIIKLNHAFVTFIMADTHRGRETVPHVKRPGVCQHQFAFQPSME